MKKENGSMKKKKEQKKKTLFSFWREVWVPVFLVAIAFVMIVNVNYYYNQREYTMLWFEKWCDDYLTGLDSSLSSPLVSKDTMERCIQELRNEKLNSMEQYERLLYINIKSIEQGEPILGIYAILKDENGNVLVQTNPEKINQDIFVWDETYMQELLNGEAREEEKHVYVFETGDLAKGYMDDYDRGLTGFELRSVYAFKIEDTVYSLLMAAKVDGFSYIVKVMLRNTILGILFSILFSYMLAVYFNRIYKKEIEIQKQQREFSNALAHDLKTPLMAISGYAENLAEHICPEKSEHYIKGIQANVTYMNHLVGKVLELAKTEPGIEELKIENIELSSMMEKILAQYEILVEKKQLEVRIEGNAVIQADREKMERVFENLLRNAIAYSPNGNQIFIQMDQEYFEITNTGVEIAKEDLNDIWKPFVTGEKSRTRESGHGLGLSIVANILNLHGFFYEMISENQSVCVKIYF